MPKCQFTGDSRELETFHEDVSVRTSESARFAWDVNPNTNISPATIRSSNQSFPQSAVTEVVRGQQNEC